MTDNNPFRKSIEEIKEIQESMQKINKESSTASVKGDVKNKDKVDKDTEPDAGVVLFNNISDTVIKIFETPEVVRRLNIISSNMNMDKDTVSSLIEIISLCVVHASYESVLFYDDLLKKELVKQFDNTVHHINLLKGESEAYKGVLQIHQKQINEIKNSLKINDIKDNK